MTENENQTVLFLNLVAAMNAVPRSIWGNDPRLEDARSVQKVA